jgi:iron complex outermembrane receptor protein
VNGYWMDFSDEIVKSGQVDRFGQPVTGNADRTRHLGVELSVSAEPAEGLELLGNVTACRNRFVRHTDYSTGAPVPLDGNPIAGFPDLLANGRVTYRVGGLSLSGSVRFVGRQYTDNFRDQQNTVDPFVVCDGWIGYGFTGGLLGETRLEARMHVTNIFNILYASYGEGSMFFVGAERSVYLGIELAL